MTKEIVPGSSKTSQPAQTQSNIVHGGTHHPTSSKRADAIAKGAGHWNLTTTHTVNLGDVDRRTTGSFPIFYIGQATHGPRIGARLNGDSAIRLIDAPMSLPSSSQPYTETNHFKVDFNPQRSGRFESVLEIDVLESPTERHRVPVVGEAHHPGDPSREEEEATKGQRESGHRDGKDENADNKLEKHNEQNRDYHMPAIRALDAATQEVTQQLTALLLTRTSGVTAARDEVDKFKRVPPITPWLLDLALAAMEVATAGIGAAVAKRLEPVAKALLSSVEVSRHGIPIPIPAAEHFVSFFSESVETSVQKVGGLGINKLQPSPEGSQGSSDAMDEFFRVERDSIAQDHPKRASNSATKAASALTPLFEAPREAKTWPKGAAEAVASMKKCASEIETETKNASVIQMRESVRHWVMYLGTTDTAGRNPSSLKSLGTEFDGVIDLTFSAQQANAAKPVTVTNAKLNGVRKSVVRRFVNTPLKQTGLAIRASCQFSPEQAVIVVQRPSRDLEYTDTPAEAGSWLAHKAGVHRQPKDVDKERGAKMLFEEIARKSLQQHLTGGLEGVIGYDASKFVENDSDESGR